MHIGFLTPEYPHNQCYPSGGLGTSIRNLAEILIAKGVKVSLIIYGQKENLKFQENGIDFYLLKQRRYIWGGWYLYRKYIQTFINDLIEEKKLQLIEAPDWTGITAFMNLNCPIVIRMNGSDAYFCHLDGRKQKSKNRFFEKTALKNANHLISVSEFTAKITNEVLGLNRDIQVIPNSIDINRFLPSNENTKLNQVIYFGSLIRKKGVLELAKIFNHVNEKFPNAELILIGKDVIDIFEKRSTLEIFKSLLTKKAAEQISYLGEVSYDEVKDFISKSQVVVLPSFAEALPMTWLEAMAMEKPLVTSNIGWAREVMIDGYTGFTEFPKKHQSYADKIIKLLQDPGLCLEIGEHARKKVIKDFSTDVVVKQNIDYYTTVINKPRES